MLFDEPTSALDPEMINEVLDVMRDLAKEGMTMMVVTHEMGFAREVANRVVFMDEGTDHRGCPAKRFFHKSTNRSRQILFKLNPNTLIDSSSHCFAEQNNSKFLRSICSDFSRIRF